MKNSFEETQVNKMSKVKEKKDWSRRLKNLEKETIISDKKTNHYVNTRLIDFTSWTDKLHSIKY